MKRKAIYITPSTEVLKLLTEDLLNPKSWNPDYPYTGNIGVIEDDPGEDNDGHGAKAFDSFVLDDIGWGEKDLWGDDFGSLWD